MNREIIKSIEAMREALYSHYDLPLDARDRAESLFARMEQAGRGCRNREEFERKIATQTLGGEYNGLFVEFTAYVRNSSKISSGNN